MVGSAFQTDGMEVKVARRQCTEIPLPKSNVTSTSPFIMPYFLSCDLPSKIDDGLYLGGLKAATSK